MLIKSFWSGGVSD